MVERQFYMKEIELSQGHKALVDDEDYDKVNALTWHVHDYGNGLRYAERTRRVDGKTQTIRMHQFVSGAVGVDHINNNGLNNQKNNFRPATKHQQQMNKRPYATRKGAATTSKYKGVSWRKKSWRVVIHLHSKQKYIGSSKCEITAAKMYDIAAFEHFGEFAFLNFPK